MSNSGGGGKLLGLGVLMKLPEPPPLPGANEHVGKYLTCTGTDSQAQGKGPPGASTDSANPAPWQKTNGSQENTMEVLSSEPK